MSDETSAIHSGQYDPAKRKPTHIKPGDIAGFARWWVDASNMTEAGALAFFEAHLRELWPLVQAQTNPADRLWLWRSLARAAYAGWLACGGKEEASE